MDRVTEIARNTITKSDPSGPIGKSRYPKILPMTVHGYEIRYKNTGGQIELSVWDGKIGAANLSITPSMFHGMKVYSVDYVGLNPKYQGQQLGYELYKGLVVLMGINLTSIGSHSVGARKLWLRLSQDPKISAYGFNLYTKEIFNVQPNKGETELKSTKRGIKLYSDYESEMGLVLTRRGSKDDKKLDKMLKEPAAKNKPDVFGVTKFRPLDHD